MKLPLALTALVSLSLTGCVAAVPMIAQVAANPNSMKQFCSMAKVPGQTVSVCDQNPFAAAAQPPAKTPPAAVSTAAR